MLHDEEMHARLRYPLGEGPPAMLAFLLGFNRELRRVQDLRAERASVQPKRPSPLHATSNRKLARRRRRRLLKLREREIARVWRDDVRGSELANGMRDTRGHEGERKPERTSPLGRHWRWDPFHV